MLSFYCTKRVGAPAKGCLPFLESLRRIAYRYSAFSIPEGNSMKMFLRLIVVLSLSMAAAPMIAPPRGAATAPERDLAKPNYDLASRWTSAKVAKMVFSTAVTPHWLEFSD